MPKGSEVLRDGESIFGLDFLCRDVDLGACQKELLSRLSSVQEPQIMDVLANPEDSIRWRKESLLAAFMRYNLPKVDEFIVNDITSKSKCSYPIDSAIYLFHNVVRDFTVPDRQAVINIDKIEKSFIRIKVFYPDQYDAFLRDIVRAIKSAVPNMEVPSFFPQNVDGAFEDPFCLGAELLSSYSYTGSIYERIDGSQIPSGHMAQKQDLATNLTQCRVPVAAGLQGDLFFFSVYAAVVGRNHHIELNKSSGQNQLGLLKDINSGYKSLPTYITASVFMMAYYYLLKKNDHKILSEGRIVLRDFLKRTLGSKSSGTGLSYIATMYYSWPGMKGAITEAIIGEDESLRNLIGIARGSDCFNRGFVLNMLAECLKAKSDDKSFTSLLISEFFKSEEDYRDEEQIAGFVLIIASAVNLNDKFLLLIFESLYQNPLIQGGIARRNDDSISMEEYLKENFLIFKKFPSRIFQRHLANDSQNAALASLRVLQLPGSNQIDRLQREIRKHTTIVLADERLMAQTSDGTQIWLIPVQSNSSGTFKIELRGRSITGTWTLAAGFKNMKIDDTRPFPMQTIRQEVLDLLLRAGIHFAHKYFVKSEYIRPPSIPIADEFDGNGDVDGDGNGGVDADVDGDVKPLTGRRNDRAVTVDIRTSHNAANRARQAEIKHTINVNLRRISAAIQARFEGIDLNELIICRRVENEDTGFTYERVGSEELSEVIEAGYVSSDWLVARTSPHLRKLKFHLAEHPVREDPINSESAVMKNLFLLEPDERSVGAAVRRENLPKLGFGDISEFGCVDTLCTLEADPTAHNLRLAEHIRSFGLIEQIMATEKDLQEFRAIPDGIMDSTKLAELIRQKEVELTELKELDIQVKKQSQGADEDSVNSSVHCRLPIPTWLKVEQTFNSGAFVKVIDIMDELAQKTS